MHCASFSMLFCKRNALEQGVFVGNHHGLGQASLLGIHQHLPCNFLMVHFCLLNIDQAVWLQVFLCFGLNVALSFGHSQIQPSKAFRLLPSFLLLFFRQALAGFFKLVAGFFPMLRGLAGLSILLQERRRQKTPQSCWSVRWLGCKEWPCQKTLMPLPSSLAQQPP